jgi:hypothetical protein
LFLKLTALWCLAVGTLCVPASAFAWQSPAARWSDETEFADAEPGFDVELVFQDKSTQSPKPTAPAKSPPSTPPRPAVPPMPAPAQPQFNPFVNQPGNRQSLTRLSRAPDMFGDSFGSLSGITFTTVTNEGFSSSTSTPGAIRLPKTGGARVFKNEQSRALPTDRVFGLYHHFENALQLEHSDANVDVYTLGVEKTFLEGNTSIELRMPLNNPVGLSSGSTGQSFQTHAAGDLIVTFKALLYSDDSQGISLGLAVNTPTGSDLTVHQRDDFGDSTFTLKNDATHLIPFIAYQAAPNEDYFFNGFLQVDTPTNANTVQSKFMSSRQTSSVRDQTLMYVDASFGYWLFRDEEANFLTGLAGLLELHYTTALNRADNVNLNFVHFGAGAGRFDVVNLTTGLQANIGRSTLVRAAFVAPLRGDPNRFFDSEVSLAIVFRL